MRISRRNMLSRIMVEAWELARKGSQKYGGSSRLYFAIALRLIWQSRKERQTTIWHPGLGNQLWIPGLSLPTQTSVHGQILLPGMAR